MARVGVIEIRELLRGRALMEERRQAEFLGAAVDPERRFADGIEVLVVRPELDPLQIQVLRRALDLLQHVGVVRMQGEKAEELLRVGADEGRRLIVDDAGGRAVLRRECRA